MATFWNTEFTTRDYECSNVIAIVADKLPEGYDPTIWTEEGNARVRRQASSISYQMLFAETRDGQRFEAWGFL